MRPILRVAVKIIGPIVLMMPAGYALPQAQAVQVQSYSIDQTRYFRAPEIESAELKPLLREAAEFPSNAPKDQRALADYMRRAEDLLGQLQRHQAFLHLRA
ncbi:MAG TPA: hypothetical protein VGH12_04680, partial [Steroidobacteraceae bacterium]